MTSALFHLSVWILAAAALVTAGLPPVHKWWSRPGAAAVNERRSACGAAALAGILLIVLAFNFRVWLAGVGLPLVLLGINGLVHLHLHPEKPAGSSVMLFLVANPLMLLGMENRQDTQYWIWLDLAAVAVYMPARTLYRGKMDPQSAERTAFLVLVLLWLRVGFHILVPAQPGELGPWIVLAEHLLVTVSTGKLLWMLHGRNAGSWLPQPASHERAT